MSDPPMPAWKARFLKKKFENAEVKTEPVSPTSSEITTQRRPHNPPPRTFKDKKGMEVIIISSESEVEDNDSGEDADGDNDSGEGEDSVGEFNDARSDDEFLDQRQSQRQTLLRLRGSRKTLAEPRTEGTPGSEPLENSGVRRGSRPSVIQGNPYDSSEPSDEIGRRSRRRRTILQDQYGNSESSDDVAASVLDDELDGLVDLIAKRIRASPELPGGPQQVTIVEDLGEDEEILENEQDPPPDFLSQDPDSEILNNGRVEVDTASVFYHTPESFHKQVDDMRSATPAYAFEKAAKLINTRASFDWAASSIDFASDKNPGGPTNEIRSEHTLDFTCVDSIMNGNFAGLGRGNITNGKLSFSEWSKPYASYRAYTATHSYYKRCMKIADVAGSEMYVVMVPKPDHETLEIDLQTRTMRQSMKYSSMSKLHATQLSTLIIRIMMTVPRLSRHGVSSEWILGGRDQADMDGKDWRILFSSILAYWPCFLNACPEGYWLNQDISFHAYQIGQDVTVRPKQILDGTLANTLSATYDSQCVSRMMFALATNVKISAPHVDHAPDEAFDEPQSAQVLSSLFNTSEILSEYENVRGANLRVFPMGFSPAVCSFQASKPPESYKTAIIDRLNQTLVYENNLEPDEEVVTVVLFQGYSVLKQYCRHRPGRHLLSHGSYTAAVCAPTMDGKKSKDKLASLWKIAEDGKPFEQFNDAVAQAVETGRIGSRFEPVLSVNFELLLPENRNFTYVCKNIMLPTMTWTKIARPLYMKWFNLYNPEVFPGVLTDFSYVFETCLSGILKNCKRNNRKAGLVVSEATATLERLSAFMFTGNTAHIPSRVWKWIGLFTSIERYGWPYIMPSRIDLIQLPAVKSRSPWLIDVSTGNLVLTHLKSIKFHFGEAAAISRETSMSMFTDKEIITIESATIALRDIIHRFMVPELQALVTSSFREQHTRMASASAAAALNDGGDVTSLVAQKDSDRRERLLIAYALEKYPLSKMTMLSMIKSFHQVSLEKPWEILLDKLTAFPSAHIDVIQPAELAALILSWNPHKNAPSLGSRGKPQNTVSSKGFCKGGMFWLSAIFDTVSIGEMLTAKDWQQALATALRIEGVDIIPGPWNGLLSGRRFTKIRDYTGLWQANHQEELRLARPTEGLYETSEDFNLALSRVAARRAKATPAFPLKVPLEELPAAYISGMDAVITKYLRARSHNIAGPGSIVAAFFRRAAATLQLNNPQHNLFLLIGYILSQATPPPVALGFDRYNPDVVEFEYGKKLNTPKDEWLFIFVVRCLMYSNPRETTREAPGIAAAKHVIELTEHKKISCRLLECVKICYRTKGVRQYPRTDELSIHSEDFHRGILEKAGEAAKISAKRVLSLWLPDFMVNKIIATMADGVSSDDDNEG